MQQQKMTTLASTSIIESTLTSHVKKKTKNNKPHVGHI